MYTLRQRRRALGLTQEQLAEALGVHPNSVRLWERGAEPRHPEDQALVAAFREGRLEPIHENGEWRWWQRVPADEEPPSLPQLENLTPEVVRTKLTGQQPSESIDLMERLAAELRSSTRGRPIVAYGEKPAKVEARIAPEDLAALQAYADEQGTTVSEVIRALARVIKQQDS